VGILKGNLAPDGSVVKHSAVPKEMFQAVLRARPFNCEEEAIQAVLTHQIKPGDAVIIRYEGPKGSGMPEMFYTTEAISSDAELGKSIALIVGKMVDAIEEGITERKNNKDLVQEEEEEEVEEMKENNEEEENKDDRRQRGNRRPRRPVGKN